MLTPERLCLRTRGSSSFPNLKQTTFHASAFFHAPRRDGLEGRLDLSADRVRAMAAAATLPPDDDRARDVDRRIRPHEHAHHHGEAEALEHLAAGQVEPEHGQ